MNRLILKNSSQLNKVPISSDLAYGELALNYSDGKLFCKLTDNNVYELSTDTIRISRSTNSANIALADTNIFIGKDINGVITSGIRNLGIGVGALKLNQNGDNNLGIGTNAGQANTSGSGNLYFGNNSGNNNTIGNNNISLGNNTSFSSNNDVNSIIIGHGSTGLGTNTTHIGNNSTIKTKLNGVLALNVGVVNSIASNNIVSNYPAGRILNGVNTTTIIVNNTFVNINSMVFTQAINFPLNRYIVNVACSNGFFTITTNGSVSNVIINYIVINN